ncbi:MAG: hypothetical protein PHI19_03670 [Clostridia bacterium]|nr:hypothetical protein [Clostridia bacterium]
MNKYISLLRYELKNTLKDKMNAFMLFYPLLMAFITGFLAPQIVKITDTNALVASYIYLVLFLMSLTMGSLIGGVLLGFSLIENKDERTFNSLAVTPASIKGYVIFKSVYSSVITFIGNLIMIYAIGLLGGKSMTLFTQTGEVFLFDTLRFYHIIVFSFVNSLLAPAAAMLMAAIAKNKVEGFVIMKSAGLVFLLPVLMMLPFFHGGTQYILGFLPHFWCTKAVYNVIIQSAASADLPFWLYNLIGTVITLGVTVLSYGYFNRKLQIST